jgi:DNA-binding GntR family transcriptional regulator
LHRGIYEGLAARDEDRAEAAARALIADTTADIQRIARRMRKSG